MYRYAEYLHFPEIALAAFLNRLRHRHPASRLDYGADPHQTAYYLRPGNAEGRGRRKRPLIIYVHGGGWRRGHPRQFRFVGRYFARLGYPVLLPGYRLGPGYQFPDQMEDLRRAVAAFLETPFARTYRPTSAVIIGQSAGGHLGAHLAYGELRAPEEGESRRGRGDHRSLRTAGFISVSGVLSFEPAGWPYLERLIKNTAADPALRRRADSRRALAPKSDCPRTPRELPTLLIHGAADRIVPPEITRAYARRHTEVFGSPPARLDLPGARHNELALLFLRRPRASNLMLHWLRAVEGEP